MRNSRLVISSIILSSASALSWAQTANQPDPHHPDAGATSQTSPSARSDSEDSALLTKKMDTHMKTMQEFHEKFQKASPEERHARATEHHDLMQEGMKMMGMASAEMQGMSMMNNMRSKTSKNEVSEACGAPHALLLKRMDMMQTMMQMMMDRMPELATPAQK